ncbi:poly-beta-1,6-N-acetyl-D-glucosamine N-deacetylase PgaB [Silvimonas iriomotensis]|uniref:Poly-beta-1,6-N-acetyl-D-glucosamine N-deacetylase PgaB n=1 Tax=Silvimonas iriomotensis TaxID=449662 RepID=A0ABQ2PB83_9NEIS|nr:poly-beta-1,6-N-acetyl-D-glucosamine N-deacetylase PgaB [Silvimonas iriomotensis]GGP22760.1 poly-beta-1,6-N-acetyl-D-glucosamine N-deacetylase PgaB [Silvimonas iriomotensis]
MPNVNAFLRQFAALALMALVLALPARADTATWPADSFEVLCYHEVRDDVWVLPDPYAISTRRLAQHFEWLRENGYHVISVDDILDARAGKKPLPPKAILLSFDDGYRSFYTNVFPLLKAFGYHAVQGVVGHWIDATEGAEITAESRNYSRDDIMTWAQIKELSDSGLVEIASHSFNEHHGSQANPQGNQLPALITHVYDPVANAYETDAQYTARIRNDLQQNSDLIAKHIGKAPRVMVWPYGRYNQATIDAAKAVGMPITLTLDDGTNSPDVGLDRLRRVLITHNDGESTKALDAAMRASSARPLRVMHVDLDYVYDPDPKQQEINLGKLLDRVKASGATTVFLQAYADPSGAGAATALYFPNRHLPMRADLFSRAAWQLETRAGVKVYAWMPLMAYVLPETDPLASHLVTASDPKGAHAYHRLSPFDPAVRALIADIYDDLATHAIFQGVLFHDDATLTDFEDDSAAARTVYQSWGLPAAVADIRKDPALMNRWSTLKTAYLTDFSMQLADRVRAWQPNLKTARNIYARVVLQPESQAWFAQSLPDFLNHYDYTAIMAMPYMEGAKEPLPWLKNLAQTVGQIPGALDKSVFELQATDWKTSTPITGHELATQMDVLIDAGARNYGYYPDDFVRDQPKLDELVERFSLRSFPYRSGK